MKKILALTLAVIMALTLFGLEASALFGTGIEVLARDAKMIKTGLLGKKLTFSDSDFKSAFAITDFDSITVTKLPSSTEGTLLLAGRRVKEGQRIKRKSIASLVFVPLSNEVEEASFSFILNGGVGCETVCLMRFLDRVNYAPRIGGSRSSVTTQAEITAHGRLTAIDPEGDNIEYIIVSYPKRGYLTLDGDTYRYTPTQGFTGYDRFSYVARDEYGNYSEVETVGIRIIERMTDEVFLDMRDRGEYNAAVALSAVGIMGGERMGDGLYFRPDTAVSRAEFVAMAMKAYGIRSDSTLTSSFFDDNSDIPEALISYVATAERMGIVDGALKDGSLLFEPNRPITKYEAAMIMARLIGDGGDSEDSVYLSLEDVPVFARSSIGAMVTLGIFDSYEAAFASSVTRAEAAEYLYRLMSV